MHFWNLTRIPESPYDFFRPGYPDPTYSMLNYKIYMLHSNMATWPNTHPCTVSNKPSFLPLCITFGLLYRLIWWKRVFWSYFLEKAAKYLRQCSLRISNKKTGETLPKPWSPHLELPLPRSHLYPPCHANNALLKTKPWVKWPKIFQFGGWEQGLCSWFPKHICS